MTAGVYIPITVDTTDAAVVAAVQAVIPDAAHVAVVINATDGFVWLIPKSGAPYTQSGGGPGASRTPASEEFAVAGTGPYTLAHVPVGDVVVLGDGVQWLKASWSLAGQGITLLVNPADTGVQTIMVNYSW